MAKKIELDSNEIYEYTAEYNSVARISQENTSFFITDDLDNPSWLRVLPDEILEFEAGDKVYIKAPNEKITINIFENRG